MRLSLACLFLSACTGTTGEHLVAFSAAAAGSADLPPTGGPIEFDSPSGFHVRLDRARLHVGAVYLNQTLPISGAQETSCILPGVYVGQVVKGLDVDLLSSRLQPFPVAGEGTTLRPQAGEVWLTGSGGDPRAPVDVTAEIDTTVILDVAGEAVREPDHFPFRGTITISKNRAVANPNPATPGAKPICKQRIVTPIPVKDLVLDSGGTLVVRADPRLLFSNVDFSRLEPSGDAPPVYQFDDLSGTNPSHNLYLALHAAAVYRFEWLAAGH